MTVATPVVLVVEDEILVREMTVDFVDLAGCTTVTASNADEAVAILESRQDIALVVTDINMAGSMDGLKLAHAVRDRWPPINIIVVSGKMRPTINELPIRAFFLAKPFKGDDLISAVRRFVA